MKIFIVSIGLVALGVLSTVCYQQFFVSASKNAVIDEYPLINPATTVIDNVDYLVRFAPLRKTLTDTYTDHPEFSVSVYFEYLPTGANISVNKDIKMWPASLIKVPIALAVMKKIERGEWQLSNELVILEQDKDPSFGSLYEKPTGTTLTIEELLHYTLVESDNTAHFVLLRNITEPELEEVFLHLGLEELVEDLSSFPGEQIEDNRMTAKNYSIFFRSLYNGTFLSPAYAQMFLEILTDTGSQYMGAAIPSEIPFAHKTGERLEEQVWADSGIVYAPRKPYLLTVMIESRDKTVQPDVAKAEALLYEISNTVFTYVETLE